MEGTNQKKHVKQAEVRNHDVSKEGQQNDTPYHHRMDGEDIEEVPSQCLFRFKHDSASYNRLEGK